MADARPNFRKAAVGALLVVGAAVALVVLRARNEPLVVAPDAAAPLREAPPPTAPSGVPVASPPPSLTASAVPVGTAIDLGPALAEAKNLDVVRSALDRGDANAALRELDFYDKKTLGRGVLAHEAALLRLTCLSRVGRRTDALALAMKLRDDPAWADEQDRLGAYVADAGLAK